MWGGRDVRGGGCHVIHPLAVRLYDVSTLQCFVSCDARDQHLDAVTCLHYSCDGRLYTTSSADGSVKVGLLAVALPANSPPCCRYGMESATDVSTHSSLPTMVRLSRQSGFPRIASMSCPVVEME